MFVGLYTFSTNEEVERGNNIWWEICFLWGIWSLSSLLSISLSRIRMSAPHYISSPQPIIIATIQAITISSLILHPSTTHTPKQNQHTPRNKTYKPIPTAVLMLTYNQPKHMFCDHEWANSEATRKLDAGEFDFLEPLRDIYKLWARGVKFVWVEMRSVVKWGRLKWEWFGECISRNVVHWSFHFASNSIVQNNTKEKVLVYDTRWHLEFGASNNIPASELRFGEWSDSLWLFLVDKKEF